jgi:RNA polymerase sigma factor (sigma-70 family)
MSSADLANTPNEREIRQATPADLAAEKERAVAIQAMIDELFEFLHSQVRRIRQIDSHCDGQKENALHAMRRSLWPALVRQLRHPPMTAERLSEMIKHQLCRELLSTGTSEDRALATSTQLAALVISPSENAQHVNGMLTQIGRWADDFAISYRHLARKAAAKFGRQSADRDDLVQEGYFCLRRAACFYNPEENTFAAYAWSTLDHHFSDLAEKRGRENAPPNRAKFVDVRGERYVQAGSSRSDRTAGIGREDFARILIENRLLDPSEAAQLTELFEAMSRVRKTVSDAVWRVFISRYIEGDSQRKVAQKQGITLHEARTFPEAVLLEIKKELSSSALGKKSQVEGSKPT